MLHLPIPIWYATTTIFTRPFRLTNLQPRSGKNWTSNRIASPPDNFEPGDETALEALFLSHHTRGLRTKYDVKMENGDNATAVDEIRSPLFFSWHIDVIAGSTVKIHTMLGEGAHL